MSLIFSKSGQVKQEIPVFPVIAVAIILILVIGTRLYGGFFQKEEEQANVASERTIAAKLLELRRQIEHDQINFTSRTIGFRFASDDHIIVGFQKGDPDQLRGYSRCTSEMISKKYAATQCGDYACLCLYEESTGNDFDDDGGLFSTKPNAPLPGSCVRLEGFDYIFTPDYRNWQSARSAIKDNFAGGIYTPPSEYPNIGFGQYAHLVIYGDCCATCAELVESVFYLEVFKDSNGKIYGLVADYESSKDQIEHRKQTLTQQHSKKPITTFKLEIKAAFDKKEYQNVLDIYQRMRDAYPNEPIDENTKRIVSEARSYLQSPAP